MTVASASPVSLPRAPGGGDAAIFAAREWLLTDGGGGYACGTALDLPTRRYHGWLCTRLPGSSLRAMLLGGCEERVVEAGGERSLLCAHWRDLGEPSLPACGRTFTARPLPTWSFHAPGVELERTLAMVHAPGGGRTVLVRWRNLDARPLRLRVRPLLCVRGIDALQREHAVATAVQAQGASWGFQPDPALPPLWLTVDGVAAFRADPCWYRNFHYAVDRARGYDHVEDRFAPGVLELDLPRHGEAVAAFALGTPCSHPATAFTTAAAKAAARPAPTGEPLWDRLAATADDFLFHDEQGRLGVLAGFPWFGEWGRDAFLAAPGLLLERGRLGDYFELLCGAARFLRRGLLPNVYGTSIATSHYGAADAALWFALAVQRGLDAPPDPTLDDVQRDRRFRQELLPALRFVAGYGVDGTDLGIKMDADGLLDLGGPGINATWMDAVTAQGPVTPRQGQPVEIQALWFSLLAELALRDGGERWRQLRDRAGATFVQRFWLAAEKRLADRWHQGRADTTVRPNMLVAAALKFSPLQPAQRAAVVACAERELLVPQGLRTLAPGDPAYRGRYEGDQDQRDRAYHQGTVWPWLLGFHVEAALRAATKKQLPAVRRDLQARLQQLLPELEVAGIDHLSEVYDGDAPRRPGGSFAQAWNSGEVLRALAMLRQGVR